MLLEINCDLEHFMGFLDKVEAAGIKPDFEMHGADENSSFSSTAQSVPKETTEESTEDNDEEVVEDKEN